MTAARFEICHGDDGWWARFRAANGRVVWVTETYTRRHNAENAVLSIARALGYRDPRLTTNAPPVEWLLTGADPPSPWLSVIFVDERVSP